MVIVHVPAVGPGPSVTRSVLPVDGVLDVSTFVSVITVIPSLVLVRVYQVSLAQNANSPVRSTGGVKIAHDNVPHDQIKLPLVQKNHQLVNAAVTSAIV